MRSNERKRALPLSGRSKILTEAWEEHTGVLGVFREARAEFLGEERFFAARLGIKGQPDNGHRQQAAHFAHSDRRAQEREQNPRVNRMTDVAIRPAANQFVSFL